MFSLKKTGVSFTIGFAVSLIAGLTGGVDFIVLFGRAIFSGLFFAALVAGAIIFYEKFFLNGESASEMLQQNNKGDMPGSNIDIMLDDDELPDSASAPGFVLATGSNTNFATNNANLKPKLNDSFQAANLDTIAASAGSSFAKKADDILVERKPVLNDENKSIADTELDMLPNIENLIDDDEEISQNSDDGIISDSVFAETGKTKPIITEGFSDMGNARDIAAAIRTVLTKDA